MFQDYFGIIVMFAMASVVSGLFIFLSEKLGPKKPNPVKDLPFETGMAPFESPSGRHAVKFYMVGMLFVIFDIELVFLFPWAVVFRDLKMVGFISMMIFLVIFELGFAYAWKKGALQWK